MDWMYEVPDEAFKALIVAGAGLAVVAGLLLIARLRSPRARRLGHSALLVGGLSFGVGSLIAAVGASNKMSDAAIGVFAVGVFATTIVYAVFIIGGSRRFRWTSVALAVLTLVTAAVMVAGFDDRSCGRFVMDEAEGSMVYTPC